jgi:hypothetical protein
VVAVSLAMGWSKYRSAFLARIGTLRQGVQYQFFKIFNISIAFVRQICDSLVIMY